MDVDEELGATRVVSKQDSAGELLVPAFRAESQSPELYRHERPVYVRAGSMLIYNMSTFHRLADLTSRDRTRYSHHIIYRLEDAPWVGNSAWPNYGQTPELPHFMERASPRQRELFGFPPPGHSYWNEETLIGVAARYPLMDMMPYLNAADFPTAQENRILEQLRRRHSTNTAPRKELSLTQSNQTDNTLAYAYCQGVADYYFAVTGVPTNYWLTKLLDYYRCAQRSPSALSIGE